MAGQLGHWGAFPLNAGPPTLIELWAWDQPRAAISDRSEAPWDDPERRLSHADRRQALPRYGLDEEFRRGTAEQPLTQKIREFVARVVHHAA